MKKSTEEVVARWRKNNVFQSLFKSFFVGVNGDHSHSSCCRRPSISTSIAGNPVFTLWLSFDYVLRWIVATPWVVHNASPVSSSGSFRASIASHYSGGSQCKTFSNRLSYAFHWRVNAHVIFSPIICIGCTCNQGDWCEVGSLPGHVGQAEQPKRHGRRSICKHT